MKLITKIVTIVFSFSISHAFAQSNAPDCVRGDDGKKNLAGKWEVSCTTEFVNPTTIKFCDLCQFNIDPQNQGHAAVGDLDLIFMQDSIVLIKGGISQTVPYMMNNDTHACSFILNKKEFKFRVFYADRSVILEDDEGSILELKREVKKGK